MGTMVAVLSQKELKLFSRDNKSGRLSFEKRLENDMNHERNIDISRHHPGMVSDGGAGVARHVMDAGQNPHDVATALFARNAGKFLDNERKSGQLTELVVIAEPRFMGQFKSEMPTALRKITLSWVGKDLDKATTPILETAVTGSLQQNRAET